MRIFNLIIFRISFLLILLAYSTIIACNWRKNNVATENTTPRYIIPSAAEGITLTKGSRTESISFEPEVLTELKVELPNSHRPIRILDVNLDNDEFEEQIVAYKVREEGSDEIRILAANFDAMYNTLISSWEGTTQSTETRSFSVFAEDIVGDYIKEIVCAGINHDGAQTLDIFRVNTDLGKRGMQFYSILSLSSRSGIEIVRTERSAQYKNRQEIGESFPIILYEQHNDEDNQVSLQIHRYTWNPQTGEFIPSTVEEIPSSIREQQHYTDLFRADISTLTEYLSGIWQSTQESDRLFYFNKDSEQLLFANKETQQWYLWDHAYRTVLRSGPGISLSVVNELVTSIKRRVWIAISSIETIEVTVDGSTHLNGTFRRIHTLQTQELIRDWHVTAQEKLPIHLDGLYKNHQGQEIYFSSPRFSMRNKDHEISGSYYVSNIVEPVLELNILDEQNNLLNHRTYAIEYTTTQDQRYAVHTIRLSPAKITLNGVEKIAGEIIVFEKTISDR